MARNSTHARLKRVAQTSENTQSFSFRFDDIKLSWDLRLSTDPRLGVATLSSTITNESPESVTLGQVRLLEAKGRIRIGSRNGELLCLQARGDLRPRRVFRVNDPECGSVGKIKTQYYNRSDATAFQVGFDTFCTADTEIRHSVDERGRLSGLQAICDFAGFQLDPGAAVATERLSVSCLGSPFEQLELWAERVTHHVRPRRWEDAPIGWLGWAWVDPLTVERYRDVVERNVEAISHRLPGFGVGYVWVSIGNLAGCTPGRWNEWNDELFPGGPEHLVSFLRSHGMKLGLWCGAFWLSESARDTFHRMKDALLCDESGNPIVASATWGYGEATEHPPDSRPPIYALDPTHPKTLEFLRSTFETYRRWGVRYYMIDFLEAAAGSISRFPYAAHFDGKLVAGPAAYRRGLAEIREAAGDDTYLLSSSGPSFHNVGMVDAIRTGNDFGEGRPLYEGAPFFPATSVINASGAWTGPSLALANQASNYYMHRKLYINDSGNVLTVDKPLALSDARINATIHAFGGGPTMLGDDIDRIAPERLAIIKKTLPRPRDVAVPVDLFRSPYPDMPKVFHRKVEKSWGRFDVIAVYNFSAEPLGEGVDLGELGLSKQAHYLLFEFWNEQYLGAISERLDAGVAPRSVSVYRLVEDTGVPTLIGTDMHLLMGEVEVLDCNWDQATLTFSCKATRPRSETGNLFVRAPEGLRLSNPGGLWIAKDGNDGCLIIRVALDFADGDAECSLVFEHIEAPRKGHT